jgi:hypothetical protein
LPDRRLLTPSLGDTSKQECITAMSNRIIVIGTRRKELDYQRLARALLALAEELDAREAEEANGLPSRELKLSDAHGAEPVPEVSPS